MKACCLCLAGVAAFAVARADAEGQFPAWELGVESREKFSLPRQVKARDVASVRAWERGKIW